ncbi:E3 ubiquitin-protein ligase MBR2-like [Vigna umbellata]|uniref:E3 ubiquitin-protein ligase MBR2-like n=1 Tax=Vigna umbellata TaxID=87088 RepID=UPI001F5F467C|nr:E3 ubiquitin-protein ligase MBR2-like [Vigna umbellata]
MNPEGGGSVGEADENNQNEEGLLEEGFGEAEVNVAEQGENNNGVSVHETLNAVALNSNISSSSFHVGSSSNTANIPRKRNLCSSGQFYEGESSNMGQQQTGEAKRLATESGVGANNINVSQQNTGTPIPAPNTGANRNENTDTGRRASYAGHPQQRLRSVQPISFLGSSFVPSATTTVSGVTVRTTPLTRCPHPRVDIIIPFYEHGSTSTWAPPQGTPRMNHYAAGSSSGTQNNQTSQQTPPSALPPNIISPELRTRLPSEVRSILDSLSNGGGLIFEIENPEPSTGLSLQTIMQHMERETWVDVDGDGPVEHPQRCTICLEDFDNGSEIGKMQLCDHKFHFDCIKQWLMQKNICPVCRRVALERHLSSPNVEYGYFFL